MEANNEAPLDIYAEVAALDKNPKWKKRAMDKFSFVRNISDMLDEGYSYMFEGQKDKKKDIREILGAQGSNKWLAFQVSVIKYLKDQGSIEDDDFDDTAGGCDEVVQDASFDVLNKMLSKKRSPSPP